MSSENTPGMVQVNEALEIIRSVSATQQQAKTIKASEALNHILAEDLTAVHDIPRFDNSAMDGYVFRKPDLDEGQRAYPVAFEVRPEDSGTDELPAGMAARIMTGSPIPPSADFVIPVELTEIRDEKVIVLEVPGRNAIRRQGEGYRSGEVLLNEGSVIRPYETGLIIESGNSQVRVKKPLRISLQVSGAEISQANNTNGPVLNGIFNSWPGVRLKEYPVLGDNPEEVKERLLELKGHSDLIVTTGGISAGKYDFFFDVLTQAGACCLIRKINQKPGKPFTLFQWDDTYVCNLPGNPVSSVFTAELYVRELAYRLNGLERPATLRAISLKELNNPGSKTLFVPGRLFFEHGMVGVEAQARMRSHLMQLYTGKQVYIRLDPGAEIETGASVECLKFSSGI